MSEMSMDEILSLAARRRMSRKPDCEYTAPGAETEAIDCWEKASHRFVDGEGHTQLLLCAGHTATYEGDLTPEEIEYPDA